MKQRLIGIFALLLALALAGCSGLLDELTPKAKNAQFESQTKTVNTASDNLLGEITSVASADESIVTVTKNEDGTVTLTSVSAGTTTVTVTDTSTDDETGKTYQTTVVYDVTVADDGGITVSEKSVTRTEQEKPTEFTPESKDIRPTDTVTGFVTESVTTEDSDESVITMKKNEDGTVTLTSKSAGSTTVTVAGTSTNSETGKTYLATVIYDVTVEDDGTITATPQEPSLTEFVTLNPKNDDENFDELSDASSADESVVSVEKNDGENTVTVTAQGTGTTTVTVEGTNSDDDAVTITYTITVDEKGKIKVDDPTVFIHKTQEIDPKKTGNLDSITDAMSDPEGIITLTPNDNDDGTYTVTAQNEGETTITVAGKKGDDIITVTYNVKVDSDGTLTVAPPTVKTAYMITFSGNADDTEGEMPAAYVEGGTSYTIKENSFTRAGWAFSGWNTKADGTGTAYNAGATITSVDESLTLYAQWSVAGLEIEIGAVQGDISLSSATDGTKVTFTASDTEEGATLIWKVYKGDTILSAYTQSGTSTEYTLETAELYGTYIITVASGKRSATVSVSVK